MDFLITIPDGLVRRLEEASSASGKVAEDLIVLAVAEKLARLEHQQWLEDSQKAGTDLNQEKPAESNVAAPGNTCSIDSGEER